MFGVKTIPTYVHSQVAMGVASTKICLGTANDNIRTPFKTSCIKHTEAKSQPHLLRHALVLIGPIGPSRSGIGYTTAVATYDGCKCPLWSYKQ